MYVNIEKGKINAVVLMGGESVEHDVSIITSVQLMHSIDKDRFNILPIYVTKDNKWRLSKDFMNISTFSSSDDKGIEVALLNDGLYVRKNKKLKFIASVDFVFNGMHGGIGENGSVAGYLDVIDIPYSSSGVIGSAVTMDKYVTKLFCEALSIPYANFVLVSEEDMTRDFESLYLDKFSHLPFPLIVKPVGLGSSVGITFCKDKKTLKEALDFAFLFDKRVIVELFIQDARELNMSIFRTEKGIEVSDIEEVSHTKDFLSFEDKYVQSGEMSGNSSRIIPAKIDNSTKDDIQRYGKSIYQDMLLSGVCRIDFLLDSNGKVYINEINSIPGSLANYLWSEKGYTYKDLLNSIYDSAIREREGKKKKLSKFSSSIISKFSATQKFLKGK